MADDDDDLDVEDTPDEPEEPAKPPRRTAKLSVLTWVLIFLNLIAAGAFSYLLLMDYKVRQDWTYAVLLNYLRVWGLPLENEEQNPGYHEAKARMRIDPNELKDAFNTPGRGGKGGGTFAYVDEAVRFWPVNSHMTEEVKKDLFQGIPDKKVGTLNEEIKEVKTTVPGKIKQSVEETAATYTDDAKKRKAVQDTLLPLAWNVYQVEKLDLRVKAASGADLDNLVRDALERKVLNDALAPLNIFYPGASERLPVEKVADLETYKLDELRELLGKRMDDAVASKFDSDIFFGKAWDENKVAGSDFRDSLEKRHKVGLLLFTLAQVKLPSNGAPVYSLERAQVISGITEFALAAQNYASSVRTLEERVIAAIKNDREGYVAGKTRSPGFAERYNAEIERLKLAVANIERAQKRYESLLADKMRFQKVHEERLGHLQAMTKKLEQARKDTQETLTELRKMQQDVYRAQLTLADAADRNLELEAEIRRNEKRLREGR